MASILVAGILFSRLYLGVHDVEDVLVGALLGAASVFLYRLLLSSRFDRWRSLDASVQVATIVAFQLVLYAVWPGDASFAGALSTGGFLVGWFASAAFERKFICYEKSRNFWRVATSGLLGAFCIILLLLFEKPHATTTVSGPELLSYAKGVVMAVVIVALAPFIFRALRLGRREERATCHSGG